MRFELREPPETRGGLATSRQALLAAERDRRRQSFSALLTALFALAAACGSSEVSRLRADDAVDYQRDIRPILSEHCFRCHGPDEKARQADLRLDLDSAAKADRGGYRVIQESQATESELMRRVASVDADEVMPPPEVNKRLTPHQISQLRRWIDAGADYDEHWAWQPLVRPEAPHSAATAQDWPGNAIDRFLLAKLQRLGLQPSPQASQETLIRRVTLDLTGLPPTTAEVDAFLNDMSPDAYERVVDRLLASPHYGERMAVDWLDAARYADTNGYQVDRDREIYAWREWVIRAFNSNQPFDDFTIEQLAGDLLPNPTIQQKIATGFHRNHMMNEEGGVIPEEFLAEYCADRVETTATVWLGQTFTCARCHDHKYDPFTQRDYYGLYAFFHNVAEKGKGDYGRSIQQNNPPQIQLPAPRIESEIGALRTALAELEDALKTMPETGPKHAELKLQRAKIQKQIAELRQGIATTLVMQEMPMRRETFILVRGQYDQPGDRVEAATPAALPRMAKELPRNRLGLARWLVSASNPLTPRVTVNRLWQAFFGTGIVSTSEDFGSQGEYPKHPRLLDWLSAEFVESGWDVKATVRMIVTSAAYRQSSRHTPQLDALDPDNRLLARGPRFRLSAESIRDQALAASGLLVRQLGGPSVRPYHPPGLYEQVVAGKGAKTYVQDTGAQLYRRTLYTYWKRSVPNPAMLAFDAPFRERCVVRRSRTNTALQALNLMNDPTYIEAARFIAQRAIRHGGDDADSRIAFGFRLVTARYPQAAERLILVKAFHRAQAEFGRRPESARALLKVGDAAADAELAPVSLAAYTVVMTTILNLDEAVTKE